LRIKVVGKTDVKGLTLILMKTLTEMRITEVNGASLYFGSGNEVIEVSAAGDELRDTMSAKKAKPGKTKIAKTAASDGWEPRQSNVSADSIIDDDSCPWD